ncbi:hypothetical protein FFI16_004190 [Pseudomonas sp. KBS0710]|nr:hypothetical protein FFI16_004190 [Pseudomonas sp. KBS0710]
MWERACSRIRWVIQHMHWLTHRIREQARSHFFVRRTPLQFSLSLPPALDYCGNCPRTLLNCAGMFHTKIKYP